MLALAARIIEEADQIEITEKDRNEKRELLVVPNGPVSNLGKQIMIVLFIVLVKENLMMHRKYLLSLSIRY